MEAENGNEPVKSMLFNLQTWQDEQTVICDAGKLTE